jgi:hypothetical protein
MSGPNRIYKDHLAAGSGYVAHDGYCFIGDSVGTIASQFVDMCTVTRTGVGQYTFTLDQAYPAMKTFVMTPVFPNGSPDFTYHLVSFSAPGVVATTHPVQTIIAQWQTGGSSTELPANCGFLVHIETKKSDQGKGR